MRFLGDRFRRRDGDRSVDAAYLARSSGSGLGGAVKGFEEGIKGGDTSGSSDSAQQKIVQGQTIEGEAREKVDQNRS